VLGTESSKKQTLRWRLACQLLIRERCWNQPLGKEGKEADLYRGNRWYVVKSKRGLSQPYGEAEITIQRWARALDLYTASGSGCALGQSSSIFFLFLS
jgi:hypothetical protein